MIIGKQENGTITDYFNKDTETQKTLMFNKMSETRFEIRKDGC